MEQTARCGDADMRCWWRGVGNETEEGEAAPRRTAVRQQEQDDEAASRAMRERKGEMQVGVWCSRGW